MQNALLYGTAFCLAYSILYYAIRGWRRRVRCKQGLHVMELEYRNGFRKTDPRYGVAERFTQNRLACRYCGALDSLNGEWQDEGRAAVYQGISWSSERMRKFERDGIIVDWQGFR